MKKKILDNGNYALIYYYDENGNGVEDEEKAASCAIFEFDSNDNLVNEATFIRSKQEQEKYIPKFDCGVDLILK